MNEFIQGTSPFYWKWEFTPKLGTEILSLYGPNSFFLRFSGHNLRWALFVYRLIGATLIGNFFDDPFLK